MAEAINANGAVPSATGTGPIAITGGVGGTPATITLASPHGSNEGDTWDVEGAVSSGNLNGTWPVHVVSATQLQLLGSSSASVSAGGYAINYSVNPLLQIPDNGDAANAGSLNVPLEGVFNTVPYLFKRTGRYSLFNLASFSGTASASTGTLSQPVAILTFNYQLAGQPVQFKAGDILELEWDVFLNQTGAGTTRFLTGPNNTGIVFSNLTFDFANLPAPTATQQAIMKALVASSNWPGGVLFPTAGIYASPTLYIQNAFSSANNTINASGQLFVKHYRLNQAQ